MKKSDAQLVSESILEEQGSFDELISRYTNPIYSFTYRLTGNTQAAEDCTQETFIKVWKKLKTYNSSMNFRAWIFTIARNTTTDFLRKRRAIPFSNLSSETFSFEEILEDNEDLPEEALGRIEDSTVVERLLAELPTDPQTVLLLHYRENMTFEEIGSIMKKPMNTVKSLHRRALQKLREFI